MHKCLVGELMGSLLAYIMTSSFLGSPWFGLIIGAVDLIGCNYKSTFNVQQLILTNLIDSDKRIFLLF